MKRAKERRRSKAGRREDDQNWGKIAGQALVNLSGAPASSLFKWGWIALIVYFIQDGVVKTSEQLKGLTTLADINLGVDASVSVADKDPSLALHVAIAFAVCTAVVAAVTILLALRERGLKQMAIANMGGQIAALERIIDPNRSSSNLLPSGEDHQEDKK